MAHFAELDENNTVIRVLVVPDSEEHRGAEYLANDCSLGGRWVQTSYNGRIRKRFAGIGMTYDENRDAFVTRKPHASWVFDEETCAWVAPVPYPAGMGVYAWDEETTSWQEAKWMQPQNLVLPPSDETNDAAVRVDK